MIEGIFELLFALVVAVFAALMAVVYLIALLLGALLEFLFLLIFHGLAAAKERANQRKEGWQESRRNNAANAEEPLENSSELSQQTSESETLAKSEYPKWNDGNETVKWIGIGVVFLVFAIVGGVHLLTQRRIDATQKKLEILVAKYEAVVDDPSTPDPISGALPDVDAWGQAIDLKLTRDMLGAAVTVRSSGPDRKLHTIDDLFATRLVFAGVKEVAKDLGKAAIDAAKKKSADKMDEVSQAIKDKWNSFRDGKNNEAEGDSKAESTDK